MFFTFYFSEIIRMNKDKQLFTNKIDPKEKFSTLNGKENIQF
jgi:hypothetical protein